MASKENLEALVSAISESIYGKDGELQFGHIKNELLDVLDEDKNFTDDMRNIIYEALEEEKE
jgi:hypothetical protein|tara:strand:+ start:220 stop:405 length:186 start_codon:yes stop_codon:yes gene_type:complete